MKNGLSGALLASDNPFFFVSIKALGLNFNRSSRFVWLNSTSPINPILTESLYSRFIHRFGVSLAEVHVAVGFGEVRHVEGYLLVYGAVWVEQGVGEEPVVGLAHIEEACRSTVVGALQPGVAQTGVVAGLLEVVDH